jgi:hypothetical protein
MTEKNKAMTINTNGNSPVMRKFGVMKITSTSGNFPERGSICYELGDPKLSTSAPTHGMLVADFISWDELQFFEWTSILFPDPVDRPGRNTRQGYREVRSLSGEIHTRLS